MHTAKAPHLHAGFRACLTLSGAAFVLETEFIQLTESSYGPVARLKHLHWLRTGRPNSIELEPALQLSRK